MSTLIIFGVIIITLWLTIRLTRRGRNKRIQRRYSRGRVAGIRVIKGKNITPARICPECGEPAGKCREMTRRAEHATGMLRPRKNGR